MNEFMNEDTIITPETEQEAVEDAGVLSSLRYYDQERRDARDVTRNEGSNVDHFTTSNGEKVALCHLSTFLPFTQGNYKPIYNIHEDMAAITLAAHHLNTGDGSIVPEIEGLNERCNIRFTTEFADTEYSAGTVLNHVVDQSNREPNSPEERLPCAFIGAMRSSISIPMSIVTGIFGYPQISGSSTSVDLDDTAQFPLFGRTIPSDQGNAVPIIMYLRNQLNIQHLTVINVNDAYGNAYVDGLRLASSIHAPDMAIHQIPLDDDGNQSSSIEAAIASVKKVEYRYIFAIVFTAETHDVLLTEAYKQDVVGNGKHNWLFADSFAGEIDDRIFPKDSILHKAYKGVGLLEASGGVPGISAYDKFVSKFPELRNPIDQAYIGSIIPTHHEQPNYPAGIPFVNTDRFLNLPITSGFAAFTYEATIAMGLAACAASENNESFSGEEHFDSLKKVEATGVAGTIKFDQETGTRLPSSVLYKVSNFHEEVTVDPATGAPGVVFKPIVTDLFQNGDWVEQTDYVFNDGTATLPADLPPVMVMQEDEPNLGLLVALPVCLAFLLVVGIYVYLKKSKSKNDMVWQVKKEEIKFASPPVIIGRGTFGMVLQAEYRGTQVAVKRVLPQKQQDQTGSISCSGTNSGIGGGKNQRGRRKPLSNRAATASMSSRDISSSEGSSTEKETVDVESGNAGMRSGLGMKSGNTGGFTSGFVGGTFNPFKSHRGALASMMMNPRQKESAIRKKLRDEFIEEMRYLSKLRHPCVTTVMGAVIGKGEEPMLIMEYMEHGSLYDLLHNETMVIEGELLLPIMRDVSQGVRFLHSANPQVIHGDLKAANILVDSKFRAKVADFGLSQKKNLGGTGTPYWMAPELLREESSNTSATDIYSFGIILYEVYSRRDPYEGEDPSDVLRLVADKHIQKRPPVPSHMPDKVKALMADCLEEDAENRPSFEELDLRLKRVHTETADTGFMSVKPSNVSLFDIFPRHIAEALRDGRAVEAEHKDSVTIFFSDIVGFTSISSELEPRKVAALLDRLYTVFDELSAKHDVFKVETIGDSYMAVTNLVKDQPFDHCKRIAFFAIDALEAANAILIDEDNPDKGVVNIRVGFHSGSVVADVVGTRNPRYCLFGDTVNTASRMESNSKENRIHCSSDSAKLLFKQCPDLRLSSRGKIPIKGKGKMQTFWVNEGSNRRGSSQLLEPDEASPGSSEMMPPAPRLETIKDESESNFDESTKETSEAFTIPVEQPRMYAHSSVTHWVSASDDSADESASEHDA